MLLVKWYFSQKVQRKAMNHWYCRFRPHCQYSSSPLRMYDTAELLHRTLGSGQPLLGSGPSQLFCLEKLDHRRLRHTAKFKGA